MQIDKRDNVAVNISSGHKYALPFIAAGDKIIKYGYPIGIAAVDIKKGEKVHTHNMRTALSGKLEYSYAPTDEAFTVDKTDMTFMGYLRENGEAAIRNEVWIVNTVGCVNKIAERLSALTGARSFPHPYGCSQLGDDMAVTQKILCGLVNHPNAAGVLVLGLGCENNNIDVFKKVLGEYDEERVLFLNCQSSEDEIAEGTALIERLKARAARYSRLPIPISKLRIGLKCGGSDAFSGITANPLVGKISDRLISLGGSTVLSEVPEMFGAETILMGRCVSEEVFGKTVSLINDFKDYYTSHNQVIYDNPSPGNKEGGITTLEEKSLGCIQKAGRAPVVDVLDYGDTVRKNGIT